MRNAGYADSQWTLLVQNYPSPIPRGSGFRYSESGYTRQSTGGCGFWNKDADWANDTALPTINGAVVRRGRRLRSDQHPDPRPVRGLQRPPAVREHRRALRGDAASRTGRSPGAVDQTEWINQIRTVSTCCGSSSPYYIQESLHPNYWAQLATRSCVRQAWNARRAAQRDAAASPAPDCVNGEPRMSLN